MKLYHVHSTPKEFHGFKDVVITWFMRHRAQPLLPYEEAIRGYAELEPCDRIMVEERLKECFTESEAEQVLAWLNENRPAKHEVVEVETTPIAARADDGSLLIGLGAIPVGGPQDFLMLNEADWTLPFKVFGYYDLRHYERVDAAEQAQSKSRSREMSEIVPHVMTNAVSGEQLVIQLKPKGGHSAVEAQAFLDGRLKEAERIDPQTCEIGWWYANAVDLYGIFEEHEEFACYGKECFVRNAPDGGWVWGGHLPEHIAKALVERMEREADTYENYLKRPKEPRELWEAKHELRRVLRNYAFFLQSDVDRAADAHKLRAHLREWQERHPDQLHPRTGDRTIVSLFDLVSTMLDIIQPDNQAAEH